MSEKEKIKEIARLIQEKENAEKKVATINRMFTLVPGARLELARCCHRRILSPTP